MYTALIALECLLQVWVRVFGIYLPGTMEEIAGDEDDLTVLYSIEGIFLDQAIS